MVKLWSVLCVLFVGMLGSVGVEGLGVNWGTISTHPLPPKIVVQMLKDNGIKKVKLFDADEDVMKGLAGSGLEVMVAIPNDQLIVMNDYKNAQKWVKENVTRYNFNGGVNVSYVAVGNEPFLKAYNGTYLNTTFPALQNIQNALNDAGLGNKVKATVPFNADVYDSPSGSTAPSAGRFRTDIINQMTDTATFLYKNNAPFMVNIYPFLSLYGNDDFPVDYAFFDGGAQPVLDNGIEYTNVFQANFDTLVAALDDLGYGNLTIFVGEVGWPTDGYQNANLVNAQRFYNGLLKNLGNDKGTPKRSGYIEVYLFGLLDEDAKSVLPGDFERHWGLFRYDGQPKYPIDLSGKGKNKLLVPAKNVEYQPLKWCVLNSKAATNLTKVTENVEYACQYADCTSLGYGSSCNGLDSNANVSYAFNSYFQDQNQQEESCNFEGLATITTQNASTPTCNFTIQIVPPPTPPAAKSSASSSKTAVSSSPALHRVTMIVPLLFFILLLSL